MKKLFLAVLLLTQVVNAQIINFPDANFKAYLLAADSSNYIAKDFSGNFFKIDVNNDGQIEVSEALQVKELTPSPMGIPSGGSNFNYESIVGISFFTNLEYLNLNFSGVTAIDVSEMANLKGLYFSNCPVNSLNVTNCTALEEIVTAFCNVSSFDLSTLVNLRVFSAPVCPVVDLDLSHNIHLETLDLSACSALVSLNVRNGNTESSRQFFRCYNLQDVCCDDEEYGEVLRQMSYIPVSTNGVNTNCNLAVNDIGNIFQVKPYPNPVADVLYFDTTAEIYTVECYDSNGRLLHAISGSSINQVNVSDLKSGVYILKIKSNTGRSNFKFIKV